jgi:hypothetical protein
VSVWDNAAVTGALGVAFGGATAYIQSALAARAKTGEELRDSRLDAYPPVWLQTSDISKYPPAEVTWADLEALHLAFRRWYYTTGGLFLSERSRDRYGDVQEVLGAYLLSHQGSGPVDPGDYDAIADTCSAFRTALTEDLATRRQRSFLLTLKSRRWHRRKEREAQAVLERFGNAPLRLPLDEMKLQSSTGPSNNAKTAP